MEQLERLGGDIDQAKVLAAAQAMADSGLREHGWSYVNIDDAWQAAARGGAFSAIQGGPNFPDMAGLCDAVHALGLKVGIYSTPWTTTYANHIGSTSNNADGSWTANGGAGHFIGSHSFVTNDVSQWAAWGIDYLKYDWNPNRVPETAEMANALRASGRDIVYSLSNSTPLARSRTWRRWRTVGGRRGTSPTTGAR